MKKLFVTLVVLTAIMLAEFTSCAQMVPMNMPIRTPYGTVNHTQYVPGHPMYHNGGGVAAKKYKFEVTFSKDSVVTLKTVILFKSDTAYFVMKDGARNKLTVYPSNTISIKRFSQIEDIVGFPTDSCWLFHVIKGEINGYSKYPTKYSRINAIQKGEGSPIIPVTKESLTPMIAGDPKALVYLQKGDFEKAVEVYNQNNAR